MIWFTVRGPDGKWLNKSTRFRVGQEEQAAVVVRKAHRAMKEIESAGDKGPLTVRRYIERWLKDREKRGVGSVKNDRNRLERFVVAMEISDVVLGDLLLDDLRPHHVRDLIRALKSRGQKEGEKKLAPRTIIHVYRTLHTVFQSAVVEELLHGNPIKIEKGELPKKTDKDPEWRSRATYTVKEVERLISDPLIPVERRVQYAFKSIAGMRHGEVAALCFRHIDHSAEPLARINIVQSYCSHTQVVKSTKTEETRAVPVHPTLAKIFASWKLEHWERIYGRKPTEDDFVVPARTMCCVNAADAGHAMRDDMDALGLRKDAGKYRKRGGHDLRSWYKTRCIEDDADSLIIRRTTHAPPKDVEGGYERFSWTTVCREVAKLRVSILDGKVLALLPSSLQGEATARARWGIEATPTGFEPVKATSNLLDDYRFSSDDRLSGDRDRSHSSKSMEVRTYKPRLDAHTAQAATSAILEGDGPRAIRIIAHAAGLTPAFDQNANEIAVERARRLTRPR